MTKPKDKLQVDPDTLYVTPHFPPAYEHIDWPDELDRRETDRLTYLRQRLAEDARDFGANTHRWRITSSQWHPVTTLRAARLRAMGEYVEPK
jgi:hypothetical protein|tara:strand:- start:262 stop:537 length:276 start_codon:yes stop_codon:yes gene_type:complete